MKNPVFTDGQVFFITAANNCDFQMEIPDIFYSIEDAIEHCSKEAMINNTINFIFECKSVCKVYIPKKVKIQNIKNEKL